MMQWRIDAGQPIDERLRDRVVDRIDNGTFCPDDLKDYFTVFTQICNHNEDILDEVRGFNKTFQYRIDSQPYAWMKIADAHFEMASGESEAPDITLHMSSGLAIGVFGGQVDPTAAYMNGDLKVDGILDDAMLFRRILDMVQEELEG
jgi:putative sterol carrier protein